MIRKKLLAEAKKVKLYLSCTIGLGLASGLLVIVQASWLSRIVSGVFLENRDFNDVQLWLILLLTVMILRAVCVGLSEEFARRAAVRIKEDLRRRLLQHLFALGPIRAKGERTGELLNSLVEGIDALDTWFSRYVPQLALAALVPLAILGFVFPVDWTSGLIMLLTAPLIPVFMILIGKWADALTQKQWQSLSRMSAHFLDVLQGITTLKLFGRSKRQIEVIARVSDQFRVTTLGVLRIAFLSALTLELLATLSTAMVAVALGLRLVAGSMQFEQAFFILLLAPEFYLPLRLLGTQFHAGMAGTSAAERIFAILETQPEVGGREKTEIIPGRMESLHLSAENIRYTYPEGNQAVLQGISFQLSPGEKVALVGASGAGKTTLVNLLLRLIEPQQGELSVNGIPLAQLAPEEWRKHIAYVPQHAHLFFGTIAENIALGKPEAGQDEIVAAAKMAGAHDFIAGLPEGYGTKIGEGGQSLSGGQVQRIALARAFLRQASLLILDEATANLDSESQEIILDALRNLNPSCSVLLIAHRLESTACADRILVMDKGQIAEEGTEEELRQKQGVYYELLRAYGGIL